MSQPLFFDNFDLHIGKQKDGVYPLSVLASPAGETAEPVNIEITYNDEALRHLLRRLPTGSIRQDELLFFARALANWLLPPGNVRDLYHHSRGQALAKKRGLRLRLRITPPELASLPWEYTYDEQSGDFLALNAQTVLVRYDHQPVPPLPIMSHHPVPILLLISNPPGTAPLETVQEVQHLITALSDLLNENFVTVDVLFSGMPGEREQIKPQLANQSRVRLLPGEASVDGLRNALRKGQYRVLHYIGHGIMQPQIGAALLLTNEKGRKQVIKARTLARELQSSNTAVVVLNSCHSATRSTALSFMGLAPALIRVGLPAVIAMQYPILDKNSIAFSRVLYQALADGWPLDAAVTEGRKAISTQDSRAQWGVPVLFMRSPNGVIWQTETEPPPSPTTLPQEPNQVHSAITPKNSTPTGQAWQVSGATNVVVSGQGHVIHGDITGGNKVNIADSTLYLAGGHLLQGPPAQQMLLPALQAVREKLNHLAKANQVGVEQAILAGAQLDIALHYARQPLSKQNQIMQHLTQAQQLIQTQATTPAVTELLMGIAMISELIK